MAAGFVQSFGIFGFRSFFVPGFARLSSISVVNLRRLTAHSRTRRATCLRKIPDGLRARRVRVPLELLLARKRGANRPCWAAAPRQNPACPRCPLGYAAPCGLAR